MLSDERVDDLVLLWEERKEQGTPVSPEELCRQEGCPELAEEVCRQVAALESIGNQLLARDEEPAPPSPVAKDASNQIGAEPGWLGPYRVLEKVGEGGMGEVFRAHDPILNRPVALKVIRTGQTSSPEQRQRFLREARAVAALDHENIVPVWEVGEAGGDPYLAMPLLRGETLGQRLEREKPLPLALVLTIARQALGGLARAHAAGIIHRDVKPDNIWLEERAEGPRVRLFDFGLAAALGERGQLTEMGAFVGTPAYLAPEQARGEPVDGRADLFSLGAILYEMTTGRRAFPGETVYAILMALEDHEPAAPHEIAQAIPLELSRLISRLLEKDRERRPASAQEVTKALAGAIDREGASPVSAAKSFQFTRPMFLALIVLFLVLIHGILWLTGGY